MVDDKIKPLNPPTNSSFVALRRMEVNRQVGLTSQWTHIPEDPGVYLIKDVNGKIIYIGKAKSLRHRIKSYFSSDAPPKTKKIISKLKDIDYIVTNSDTEALILEADLIKLHLPKYNVRLKDDKKYPYIKVTIKEDFPTVYPTRDLRDKDSIYFGPYTNAKNMRKALKFAQNLFPVRMCKGKLPKKVCLAYHIGRCPGPCEGKISKEEYRTQINRFLEFLAGKSDKIEKELENEMKKFAENLEFESAAKIRDKLAAIRDIVKKHFIVSQRKVDIDVFGLARAGTNCICAFLRVRAGRVMSAEHYALTIRRKSEDGEIIRAFLLQFYKNAFYIPEKILVPAIEEKEELEMWLNRKISIPTKKEEKALIGLAEKNAKVRLEEEFPKKVSSPLEQLKAILKLPEIPMSIEAFDVSNISGEFACGSSVLFVNGRPQKSGYRRYKIKTVSRIDDYAMMKEIVQRRMKHKNNLPNLVLIDGGIGQVRAAREGMGNISIPIFGLAKRLEELYLEDGRIVSLPKDSSALKLLQRIRDEAHRFAISYHRKLRDRSFSILDEIPNIGEKRRIALLKYFLSLDRLKDASLDEIKKVKGIGEKYAKKIYEYLHGYD